MNASTNAACLAPSMLPLDTMPLDLPAFGRLNPAGPGLPARRQRPRPPATAQAASPPAAKPVPEAGQPVALPSPEHRRTPRRRRPLARFVQEDDSPIFYISLSDLMCLLLVFFVLIFSLGQPSEPLTPQGGQNAQQAPVRVIYRGAMPVAEAAPKAPAPDPFAIEDSSAASIRLGLVAVAMAGASDPGLPASLVAELSDTPQDNPSTPRLDRDLLALLSASDRLPDQAAPLEETSLSQLLGQVKRQLAASGPSAAGLEVERGSDRVVLRLPEAITFDLAKAEVKPGMQNTLARLAQVLARHPRTAVIVTGHTDDLPIATPQFASNWELSGARAAAVGRSLMAKGIDKSRLTIRGLADQQPRLPNLDQAARQQNRRVEIELRPLG